MNKPRATPPPVPTHLRPITIEIPATWTPEQALAVFDLLDELKEKIWARYSCEMQDLLRDEQISPDIDDGKHLHNID